MPTVKEMIKEKENAQKKTQQSQTVKDSDQTTQQKSGSLKNRIKEINDAAAQNEEKEEKRKKTEAEFYANKPGLQGCQKIQNALNQARVQTSSKHMQNSPLVSGFEMLLIDKYDALIKGKPTNLIDGLIQEKLLELDESLPPKVINLLSPLSKEVENFVQELQINAQCKKRASSSNSNPIINEEPLSPSASSNQSESNNSWSLNPFYWFSSTTTSNINPAPSEDQTEQPSSSVSTSEQSSSNSFGAYLLSFLYPSSYFHNPSPAEPADKTLSLDQQKVYL